MAKRKTDKRREPKQHEQMCEWFLLCDRPATGTTPHSVLGEVPTCDRCHKFATGEERKR